LKKELKSVLDLLDHKDLNELPYFEGESPSSEMISMFIYNQLKEKIGIVSKISVWETPTSCASYFEE
jgi:6-pyruvoyltetrahydropterin/6-carboxytetrahydropterin synthase